MDDIWLQTDLSISNLIVKTGTGFGAGVVLSALLFRSAAAPSLISMGHPLMSFS